MWDHLRRYTPQSKDAQLVYVSAPKEGAIPDIASPEVEQRKLSNGSELILCPAQRLNTFSIAITSTLGSQNEPRGMEGAVHYMEHMACTGTTTPGRSTFVALDEISKMNGGTINACTNYDFITLNFSSAAYGAHIAADLTLDRAFKSSFTTKALEEQLGAIRTEMAEYNSNSGYIANCIEYEHFYRDTTLEHPVLGYPNTISNLTVEDLKNFYEEAFRPERVSVTVSGNFTQQLADEVQSALEKHRAQTNNNLSLAETPDEIDLKSKVGELVLINRNESLATTCISYPGLTVNDPDFFALDLFDKAFGDGISSRLIRILREEKGLVYGGGSAIDSYSHSGIFRISYASEPGNADAAAEITGEIIQEVLEKGLTEQELLRAKAMTYANVTTSIDSADALCGSFNAEALRSRHTGRELMTHERYLRGIAHTGLDDIARVCKRLFSEQLPLMVVVGQFDPDGMARAFSNFYNPRQ